VKRI
jgi:hypothetical protein